MVIKDSFANCFILLTKHYQRIIVADLRHLIIDYLELAEQNGITDLLILYITPNSAVIRTCQKERNKKEVKPFLFVFKTVMPTKQLH